MRFNGNTSLIFVHLPKCAGTSLNRIIEWEYGPRHVFSIDPSFFRWSYRRLLHCDPKRLSRIKAFQGHMPFGLHRHLLQPSTYLTILRNPIERGISEYYYARSRIVHPQHAMMKHLSLEQYMLETPYLNVQTKLLAGMDPGYDFLAGDCTLDTLARAKDNLSTFAIVGLAERFNETLALAKIRLGWRLRSYARFNVTARRPKTCEVPVRVRDLIADRYKFDMKLYEYGTRLFHDTVESHHQDLETQLNSINEQGTANTTYGYKMTSAAYKAVSRLHSYI